MYRQRKYRENILFRENTFLYRLAQCTDDVLTASVCVCERERQTEDILFSESKYYLEIIHFITNYLERTHF